MLVVVAEIMCLKSELASTRSVTCGRVLRHWQRSCAVDSVQGDLVEPGGKNCVLEDYVGSIRSGRPLYAVQHGTTRYPTPSRVW